MTLLDRTGDDEFARRFREQMMKLASPFDRGIMQKNTDLILRNMRLISEIISRYDVRELVNKNVNILKMALDNPSSRRILLAARKLSKYIYWDNDVIYQITTDVLREKHGIIFGPKGRVWLRRNIEMFRQWLISEGPKSS